MSWRWIKTVDYPTTKLVDSLGHEVLEIYESHGGGAMPSPKDATLIVAAPELARVGHRLYLAVQALSARSLMDANANARNMREAAEAVQEWREVSEKAGLE